jgi:hypothetical protein
MTRTLSLVLLTLLATPARAQSGAVVGIGLVAGYGVLSGAALGRLFEFHRGATPGDDVRLVIRAGNRTRELRGQLSRITSDSIGIQSNSAAERVALHDVRRIDVYRGPESKWAQGWAIGLGGGAAIGAVGGFASGDDKDCDLICFNAPQKALILGVAGGIAGSLLGAGVGALVESEHWTRVARLDQSRVAISPVIGRTTTGLMARFSF